MMKIRIVVDVEELLRRILPINGNSCAPSYEIQDASGRWINTDPQQYRNLLRRFQQ